MKKRLAAIFALFLTLVMAFPTGIMNVSAEEEGAEDKPVAKAYIMYADSNWGETTQKWDPADDDVVVTGSGTYTVSITSETPFNGFAFAAIGIDNGEICFPGATIEVKSIKINDKEISFTKGYTSSDNGIVTRMNLYNEWVDELPADARSFDNNIEDATPFVISNDYADVTKMEITFDYHVPTAYIMFADKAWKNQFWLDGKDYEGVTATNVEVTGPGEYTVKIDCDTPFDDLAFMGVGLSYGEAAFPAGCFEILSVKINGEDIEFGKGYTIADDNGIGSRINLYNEWVPSTPEEARCFGDVSEAEPIIISPEVKGVSSMEVTFKYHIPTAYIMFADPSWATQYWFDGKTYEGVTAQTAMVNGAGEYTVSMNLAEGVSFDGLAFLAIGIQDAEKIFPGYCIELKSIKINGEKYEVLGKGYTSSDDKITTRMNLFNEWVTDIPADARSFDENIEGVSPKIVANDIAGINKIEIKFNYVAGKKEEAPEEEDTFDYEAALKETYKAYMSVQTAPNFVFRNDWFEKNYGINAEGDFFSHLTGWDADSNATNNGGKFTDVEIKGDGTYSVRLDLAEGDAGFANQESYNYLYVSTTIPYKLIEKGYIEIKDVKTSFDGGASRPFTYVEGVMDNTTKTEYAEIMVLSKYNEDVGEEAIPYTIASSSIVITFTVTGFDKAPETPGDDQPAATTAPEATAAPEAPQDSTSNGVPVWVWIVAAVGVVAVACVVVVVVMKKKKK